MPRIIITISEDDLKTLREMSFSKFQKQNPDIPLTDARRLLLKAGFAPIRHGGARQGAGKKPAKRGRKARK